MKSKISKTIILVIVQAILLNQLVFASAETDASFDKSTWLQSYENVCIISFAYEQTADSLGGWAVVTFERILSGNLKTGQYRINIPWESDGPEPIEGRKYIAAIVKTRDDFVQERGEYSVMRLIAYEKDGYFVDTSGYNFGTISQIQSNLSGASDDTPIDAIDESTDGGKLNGKQLYSVQVRKPATIYDQSGKKKLLSVAKDDALLVIGSTYKKNGTIWIDVFLEDGIGRIKANYLKKNSRGKIITSAVPEEAIWYSVSKSTYLYKSASSKATKIGISRKGTMIAVIDMQGNYYKVLVGNKTGYVLASKLERD